MPAHVPYGRSTSPAPAIADSVGSRAAQSSGPVLGVSTVALLGGFQIEGEFQIDRVFEIGGGGVWLSLGLWSMAFLLSLILRSVELLSFLGKGIKKDGVNLPRYERGSSVDTITRLISMPIDFRGEVMMAAAGVADVEDVPAVVEAAVVESLVAVMPAAVAPVAVALDPGSNPGPVCDAGGSGDWICDGNKRRGSGGDGEADDADERKQR